MSYKSILSNLALIVFVLLGHSSVRAMPISGWEWSGFVPGSAPTTNPGTGTTELIRNTATSSPILGNGTDQSAATLEIYAAFPQVSLVNDGDTIKFSGAFTVEGISLNPAKEKLRIGLFDDQTAADNATGWAGYWLGNVTGTSTDRKLHGRASLTTASPTSTSGGGAPVFGPDADFGQLNSATYDFEMVFMRSGPALSVSASIISTDPINFPYSQVYTDVAVAGGPLVTFDFDRVAILSATPSGAWTPDVISFSNLDVAYVAVPEAPTMVLLGLFIPWMARLVLRKNNGDSQPE